MRHSRPLAVAVLLASASLAGRSAAAATKLTAANSIPFEFFAGGVETFAGTDCGGTATVTRTLPAGSQGIKLVNVLVGERGPAMGPACGSRA